MMHELIDREDPRCLYCNSRCDIEQDGGFVAGMISLMQEVQILKCFNCKEKFEVHWIDDAGTVTYLEFVFSCKDIVVVNRYAENNFYIVDKKHLYNSKRPSGLPVTNPIPQFTVDFSDKKKLYEKLRTYRVFS
jgi:hypothetical protein